MTPVEEAIILWIELEDLRDRINETNVEAIRARCMCIRKRLQQIRKNCLPPADKWRN